MKRNSKDWGPPSGGKGDSLFDRPLVPMVISLAGGILTACQFPLRPPLLLAISFGFLSVGLGCMIAAPSRFKAYGLIPLLFAAGALRVEAMPSTSVLAPLAEEDQTAIIEGVVLDPVRVVDERMMRFSLRGQTLSLPDRGVPLDESISVTVYRNILDLQPGERIRFRGKLRPFRNFNNPGHYDHKLAMELKGLTCAAGVSDGAHIERLGRGRLPFFRRLTERLQRPLRDFFHQRLPPSEEALFRALILGEQQEITPALRAPFTTTGLGHILAVSGLHVGLVAGTVFFLLRGILLRSYRAALSIDVTKAAALMSCFPVIGYAFLAGLQVSTQRAMIMVLAYLISIVLGRGRDVWSTLGLAGFIVLLLDPKAILTISFQLSFLAVVGILWLAPAILSWFHRPPDPFDDKKPGRSRLLDYFIGLGAASAAATFFLLPLTTFYFHRIPLVSLPANLTALPILGMWVIPAGLLASAGLPFSTALADVLLQMGAWGLSVMVAITQFWARLPWASIWTITPNLFEILLFYLLIASTFYFKRSRWAKMGLAVAVLLAGGDVAYWVHRVSWNKELQVTFLDVGKGNAALVSFPGGKRMLIDGGGFPGDGFDVGEMVVAPFLWRSKILRVDYVVLSHPQADHMNGLRFIASHFRPREFWHNGDRVETPTYRELMEILDSQHIRKRLPADLKPGMEINGVWVEVLHPNPDDPIPCTGDEGKCLNNRSLVLRISYGNTSFLFPGDLEKPGEESLVARFGSGLRSDILLSPHHGSKTSSTREFLTAVSPRLCIVSSGEKRPRRFPHPTVLARLRGIGCRILRTPVSGAVTVTVGQNRFHVRTFLQIPDPSEGSPPGTRSNAGTGWRLGPLESMFATSTQEGNMFCRGPVGVPPCGISLDRRGEDAAHTEVDAVAGSRFPIQGSRLNPKPLNL